ncbi:MAG: hypothetical protein AB4058_19320 [Microcystaceae cyanobacterium]
MANNPFDSYKYRDKFLQCNYSLIAWFAMQNLEGKRGVVIVDVSNREHPHFIFKNSIDEFSNISPLLKRNWQRSNISKQLLVAFQIEGSGDPSYYHALGSSTFPVTVAACFVQCVLDQEVYGELEESEAA